MVPGGGAPPLSPLGLGSRYPVPPPARLPLKTSIISIVRQQFLDNSMSVQLERERLERLQLERRQLEEDCERLMQENESLNQQVRRLQERISMPWFNRLSLALSRLIYNSLDMHRMQLILPSKSNIFSDRLPLQNLKNLLYNPFAQITQICPVLYCNNLKCWKLIL